MTIAKTLKKSYITIMKTNSVYTELIELIAQKSGVDKSLIKRETTIEDGLGVTGEDAEELIVSIQKKFNIDIKDFVFSKYFNDEPSIFNSPRNIQPLTVGDLEHAVLTGKLE
jgi:acyl carrier protein